MADTSNFLNSYLSNGVLLKKKSQNIPKGCTRKYDLYFVYNETIIQQAK